MPDTTSGAQIHLLGGFALQQDGAAAELPLAAQRLIALTALQDGGVIHRGAAATRLWPQCRQSRAAANLRSALWQSRRGRDAAVIEARGARLGMARAVSIDVRTLLGVAREISRDGGDRGDRTGHLGLVDGFSRELLPDWTDNWLVLDRERWDQVRLHALEVLARDLMARGEYLAALEAALAAVAVEPVRESAHRIVIEIYLAEGNAACAVKQFHRYRGIIQRELGVSPSRTMLDLIDLTEERPPPDRLRAAGRG